MGGYIIFDAIPKQGRVRVAYLIPLEKTKQGLAPTPTNKPGMDGDFLKSPHVTPEEFDGLNSGTLAVEFDSEIVGFGDSFDSLDKILNAKYERQVFLYNLGYKDREEFVGHRVAK